PQRGKPRGFKTPGVLKGAPFGVLNPKIFPGENFPRGKILGPLFPKGENPGVLKPRGLKGAPFGVLNPQNFPPGKIFPGEILGPPFPPKGKTPGF
ncbi:hypothetical protein NV63_18655, partial [Elizabethkingia anophelis]